MSQTTHKHTYTHLSIHEILPTHHTPTIAHCYYSISSQVYYGSVVDKLYRHEVAYNVHQGVSFRWAWGENKTHTRVISPTLYQFVSPIASWELSFGRKNHQTAASCTLPTTVLTHSRLSLSYSYTHTHTCTRLWFTHVCFLLHSDQSRWPHAAEKATFPSYPTLKSTSVQPTIPFAIPSQLNWKFWNWNLQTHFTQRPHTHTHTYKHMHRSTPTEFAAFQHIWWVAGPSLSMLIRYRTYWMISDLYLERCVVVIYPS